MYVVCIYIGMYIYGEMLEGADDNKSKVQASLSA